MPIAPRRPFSPFLLGKGAGGLGNDRCEIALREDQAAAGFLFGAFVDRVFVLDGDRAVVAVLAECGDDLPPVDDAISGQAVSPPSRTARPLRENAAEDAVFVQPVRDDLGVF